MEAKDQEKEQGSQDAGESGGMEAGTKKVPQPLFHPVYRGN